MSNNTLMFPGSADVYIRYHDILGTPMFNLYREMGYGNIISGVYNMGPLRFLPIEHQIINYLRRKRFNFLNDPDINILNFTEEENDRMLKQLLQEVNYQTFSPVNLYNAFFLHPIAERVHVYSKFYEPQIESVIEPIRGNCQQLDYKYGNFDDIIKTSTSHASLVTTSTSEARTFLKAPFKHRYVSIVFPVGYDDLRNISDIYSDYADQINVIDIRNRLKIWKENIV